MSRLYINPTLEKNIRSYCEINGIEDVNAFANRCASQGLNIIKFGTSPIDNINRENNGIKDVPKNVKQKKKDPVGEDKGKQVTRDVTEGGERLWEESKKEEEVTKPTEKVTVRKIQIVKKQ